MNRFPLLSGKNELNLRLSLTLPSQIAALSAYLFIYLFNTIKPLSPQDGGTNMNLPDQ